MDERHPSRRAYVGLALVTIVAGLWIHRGIAALDSNLRDVLGDALWAMMITWWVSAVIPRRPILVRGGVALGICWLVEASQLVHGQAIDAVRATTPGQLVLGSGFDPRDLVAYAGGVVIAALAESSVRRLRRGRSVRSARMRA